MVDSLAKKCSKYLKNNVNVSIYVCGEYVN